MLVFESLFELESITFGLDTVQFRLQLTIACTKEIKFAFHKIQAEKRLLIRRKESKFSIKYNSKKFLQAIKRLGSYEKNYAHWF